MTADFTIEQVAIFLDVPLRTAADWFDSGRLKGYRIPGSQARRIPLANLIRFYKWDYEALKDIERKPTAP